MMKNLNVKIIEVGPRDGLQNEKKILSTADRVTLVKKLAVAGLNQIEFGAYVSPKWVPQMYGTERMAKSLNKWTARPKKLSLSALVPNEYGMQEFLKNPSEKASLFTATSEKFSFKNTNCSIKESFERMIPIIKLATKNKIKLRAYISTVFGCPFEGQTSLARAVKLTDKFFKMGVHEVSIGDTIGVASPKQVRNFLDLCEKKRLPMNRIAMHFHDTRGTALANVVESLNWGIRSFDTSIGGLGGCPYAPGALGNLATEDLVYLLKRMGYKTSVNLKSLVRIHHWIQKKVAHPLNSHVGASGPWILT